SFHVTGVQTCALPILGAVHELIAFVRVYPGDQRRNGVDQSPEFPGAVFLAGVLGVQCSAQSLMRDTKRGSSTAVAIRNRTLASAGGAVPDGVGLHLGQPR